MAAKCRPIFRFPATSPSTRQSRLRVFSASLAWLSCCRSCCGVTGTGPQASPENRIPVFSFLCGLYTPRADSRAAANSISIHHFVGTSQKRRRQIKAERLGGSVSVAMRTAPLARKRVPGIDPAIGIGTVRGRHALCVARELAIARIAPYAPLQAVAILYCLSRCWRY